MTSEPEKTAPRPRGQRSIGPKTKCLFVAAAIILGLGLGTAVTRNKNEPIRLPTSLVTIDGRYFQFVKRNPPLTPQAAKVLGRPFHQNDDPDLHHQVIEFASALPLDRAISLNAALHALMTFGPDHPVHLAPDRTVPVLNFIQDYFDYIPSDVRRYAPDWIDQVGGEFFVIPSSTPRVIADHLGQLPYVGALARLPLQTRFTLKTGRSVSLKELLETEIKYADPDLHDPAWQTVALAYYRPRQTWRNVSRKSFSALHFLEKAADRVPGHVCCGHTHMPISTAYAFQLLRHHKHSYAGKAKLSTAKIHLDYYVQAVKETLYPDGTVSKSWWSRRKEYPRTTNELVILNGHTLEWLATYLDHQQLQAAWVKSIADRFCVAVMTAVKDAFGCNAKSTELPFEYAPLCHGVRALVIYHQKAQTHPERNPK